MRVKAISAEEKYMSAQAQLERELVGLRKEFRVLDGCRSRPSGDDMFEKMRRVWGFFAREHANILTDLNRAADPGAKKAAARVFDRLGELLAAYDSYDHYVDKFKVYMEEVEGEIRTTKKEVYQLRKRQTSDAELERRNRAAMKTVEALENRLETQMIKFGTICMKNKKLREEIDHLLWERRVFLKQWDTLVGKLSRGKQIMLDLIQQATIAYNQREEWCNKLQALRIRAHNDYLCNIQEMRECRRKHDQQLKLEEFFLLKGQKRVMRDLEERLREKREERNRVLQKKFLEYTQMVEDVKRFTRLSDIQKISRLFHYQDAINVSNFKYVIDVIREMETVGDDLQALHSEIDDKRILHKVRTHQQEDVLAKLTRRSEDCQVETKEAEDKLEETNKYFDELLRGVTSLFKICKCDKDPLLQLLGDNRDVHFYNVSVYLEILETKIQQLLIGINYKEKTLSEKKKIRDSKLMIERDPERRKMYTLDQICSVTPCSLCMEHELVTDVIDTVQHPLSKKEASNRLSSKLKLQEGATLYDLHNISDCQLPRSRGLIQKRYQ